MTQAVGTSLPRLSVAMIVRDEAQMLPEFLENIQPLADEICLVDTGSTDDTVALAEAAGCVVSDFCWCDDFSAARNVALKACTGSWVLVLDADERIAETDRLRLRQVLLEPRDRCYRITTRNYTDVTSLNGFTPVTATDPFAKGFPGWFPSEKVRLFPNIKEAAFEGRVHELVHPSLEAQGMSIENSDIPIHHYPLLKDPAFIQQKRESYLALGLKKVQDVPQSAKAYAELGAQYIELGRIDQAVKAYRQAVGLNPENARWLQSLGSTLFLVGQKEAANQALRLAVQRDPDQAEAWRNLGVIAADRRDWSEAIDCFQEAIRTAPMYADTYRYLALVLDQNGQADAALESCREALRLHPENQEAQAFLDYLSGS